MGGGAGLLRPGLSARQTAAGVIELENELKETRMVNMKLEADAKALEAEMERKQQAHEAEAEQTRQTHKAERKELAVLREQMDTKDDVIRGLNTELRALRASSSTNESVVSTQRDLLSARKDERLETVLQEKIYAKNKQCVAPGPIGPAIAADPRPAGSTP